MRYFAQEGPKVRLELCGRVLGSDRLEPPRRCACCRPCVRRACVRSERTTTTLPPPPRAVHERPCVGVGTSTGPERVELENEPLQRSPIGRRHDEQAALDLALSRASRPASGQGRAVRQGALRSRLGTSPYIVQAGLQACDDLAQVQADIWVAAHVRRGAVLGDALEGGCACSPSAHRYATRRVSVAASVGALCRATVAPHPHVLSGYSWRANSTAWKAASRNSHTTSTSAVCVCVCGGRVGRHETHSAVSAGGGGPGGDDPRATHHPRPKARPSRPCLTLARGTDKRTQRTT